MQSCDLIYNPTCSASCICSVNSISSLPLLNLSSRRRCLGIVAILNILGCCSFNLNPGSGSGLVWVVVSQQVILKQESCLCLLYLLLLA